MQNIKTKKTGLWYDILDKPNGKGNYLEASASSMFVYAIAKGVRLGYLAAEKINVAKKGYQGIIKNFIEKDANGQTNLKGTVSVSGLGGSPYRDGSYEYYLSEKVITNDAKGIGAFLLASNEMEILPTQNLGKGKTVLMDHYFNQEFKKDITGTMMPYHYTWNDMANSGFSLLGNLFNNCGAKTTMTENAPTTEILKNVSIYFIVDPDGLKDNPNPNYMTAADAEVIANWVKNGGVLMMMTNDTSNCDQVHINQLAAKFGMHFNDKSRNMVKNDFFETGAVHIPTGHNIFPNEKQLYLKEISTISTSNPASASITEGGDIIFATAKYGKGTVLAVGDPWIYNEYLDGRKGLPKNFENYGGAKDLVRWLLGKTKVNNMKFLILILIFFLNNKIFGQDIVAENMLMFQRFNGGWPKHYEEKEIDFKRNYTEVEKATIKDEVGLNDATIDNDATNKEIRYLLKAFKTSHDKRYIDAAENGIKYLLKAQYANGGWPQFYPDFTMYRSQITYNDNAMINTINLLQDIVWKTNDMEMVNPKFIPQAEKAVKKGIDCILKTQIRVKGKLTVWCAQYNAKKLLPEMARKFELASLSGSESVGIVEFLMRQPKPSKEIKEAIKASIEWFKQSKIVGYRWTEIAAPGTPKGRERVIVKDSASTIWARFYDIETNRPFFSDRDSRKVYDVQEIGYERRNGYAWYGTWPMELINKKYPEWLIKNK